MVRGQPEASEKMIAARREREARRHEAAAVTDRYFKRLDAQSQLFHKWEQDKTMLRYPQRKTRSLACLTDPALYRDDFTDDRASLPGGKFMHHKPSYLSLERRTKSPTPSTSSHTGALARQMHEHSTGSGSDFTSKSKTKYAQHARKARQSRLDGDVDKMCELERRRLEERANHISSKLRTAIDKLTDLRSETKQLRRFERTLVACNSQVVDIRKEFNERRDVDWSFREKKISFMHFARDKLRQKAFIICDQLMYARAVVKCLDEIMDALCKHSLITDDEYEQFTDVNQSATKLVDTYLNINQQRNYHYQLLYQYVSFLF